MKELKPAEMKNTIQYKTISREPIRILGTDFKYNYPLKANLSLDKAKETSVDVKECRLPWLISVTPENK